MTRSGEKRPSRAASPRPPAPPPPQSVGGRRDAAQTFGRFVGTLAKLEGSSAPRGGKGAR